ncbi:ROK family protein [Arthrobacter sp. MSA 4-2]|uniref:ROK family protein n=1 Tax=Arthrobacter sp. MSA 4-2 TaxID=2794349 RepID=UPI0027DE9664|nr:ROK family protein [Arthrobacter sp. MSA 4-2]
MRGGGSAGTGPGTWAGPQVGLPADPVTGPGAGSGEPPARAVLAFDVGGTDMKAALVDDAGQLHSLLRIPTPRDRQFPGDVVVAKVAALTESYRAEYPGCAIESIGLVVPGLVDEEAGIGLMSANLGWRDYRFGEHLTRATGLPVAFGHDVSIAGEAEMRAGAGRGLRDVVVMVIGTGIAGAVFCEGQRVRAGGYAGEIGHAEVPGGTECPCGAFGCLETIGSAGAITRRYNALSGNAAAGAETVLTAARNGDRHAAQVWDDAVNALAFSICQLTAILGTEAVILGGGLAQAGPALVEPLQSRVESRLSFLRTPRILTTVLGQDAGLIGAGLRARDLVARP